MTSIVDEMKENLLRWFGHGMRRKKIRICNNGYGNER